MSEIKITESSLKNNNILYIKNSLAELTSSINVKSYYKVETNRCEIKFDVYDEYKDLFIMELEDKIADIIAVNYKYNFFIKNVKVSGLTPIEYDLLITSLISADVEEDKRYVIRKLKNYDEYSIDGIFNFRMKPLKEKWKEIVSYIPVNFNSLQLKDFITYLIKDKSNKKVYYENGNVYDKRFIKLNKISLLYPSKNQLPVIKEILLSGAGLVEISSSLPEEDERYIKAFFENRIRFSESYLQ